MMISCDTVFQASALCLQRKSPSISELIQAAENGAATEVQIVWRNRMASPIKLRSVLADTKCRTQNDVIVDEANGFYAVEPADSVIFLSKSEGKYLIPLSTTPVYQLSTGDEVMVELIVLRGVAQA